MSVATKSDNALIDRLAVTAAAIPTDFPESDGTLSWDKTTIVIAEANCGGVSGIGYTYSDLSTAILIETMLKGIVEGRDAMDISGTWNAMVHAIRNLGRSGIASMAISAVDIALWDLKSKLLGLPLVKPLGAVRTGIPVYGSGGFTSYSDEQLQRQLGRWVESGGISVGARKYKSLPHYSPRKGNNGYRYIYCHDQCPCFLPRNLLAPLPCRFNWSMHHPSASQKFFLNRRFWVLGRFLQHIS